MDFRAAYFHLYGEVANAIEEIETGKNKDARARLILAQQILEERYISAESGLRVAFPKKKPAQNEPER